MICSTVNLLIQSPTPKKIESILSMNYLPMSANENMSNATEKRTTDLSNAIDVRHDNVFAACMTNMKDKKFFH